MISKSIRLVLASLLMLSGVSFASAADEEHKLYDLKMKTIDGTDVDLSQYKGKVLLIVNTASQCGLTPQYRELQELQDKYADKGFTVLGFPCNQFGRQEPGSNAEISEFCTANYGVTFDMFSKIEVNGEGACDLYKYLTALDLEPKGKGDISWNFEKFLVDREGNVVARFEPRVKPSHPTVIRRLNEALDK